MIKKQIQISLKKRVQKTENKKIKRRVQIRDTKLIKGTNNIT